MRLLLSIIFVLICLLSISQEFSIKILDENHHPLENALLSRQDKTFIGSTPEDGTYFIKKISDSIICISKLGYYDTCLQVKNGQEILLKAKNINLNEVIVSSQKNSSFIKSNQTGVFQIKTDSLKNLPTIMGETDPMRLLQLAPGVSKSEFNMGLNIRGSTTDQNMILIDDAVIYNPTHLAGFLSIFNPLIIDKITLLKSGIPAEYGGKISSVTIIESDKKLIHKTSFEANVGVLLSGFVLKTPIMKEKLSITLAARRSYIDQFIKPLSASLFSTQKSLLSSSAYAFYDINAGLVYAPTLNDKIFVNYYQGHDDFGLVKTSFDLDYTMNWGNKAVSAKWVHLFDSHYFMKTTVYQSSGDFNIYFGQNDFYFQLHSQLRDYSINHDHTFLFNKSTLKIGLSVLYQNIIPNKSNAQLLDLDANFGTPNTFNTCTFSSFLQWDYEISPKISFSAGLRGNDYFHFGPFQKFLRNDGISISDTIFFKKSDVIKNYTNWEPRFSMRFSLDSISSLKFSITRNIQYLQQVNVSSVALPTDFWIPASYSLEPQIGIQATLGYYHDFFNKSFSLSTEIFYKSVNNVTEFEKGILSTVSKAAMEENIIIGKGRSYGLEISFEKKSGKITGWLSYTLSRSERIFKEINNGNPYPAKYDRTHDLSVTGMYRINNKWSTSLVFVMASGSAVTLPVARYMVGQNIVNQYGKYNSFRMPTYHRMDFSFTRTFRKKGILEQKLNFGLFNAYNRLNPFFMYFKVSGDLEKYKLKVTPKYVAIFPVLPFVSYNLNF